MRSNEQAAARYELEIPAIVPVTQTITADFPRAAPPIAMLGVAFDNLTLAGTAARIEEMIASREPHYVVTANVDFLVQARQDTALRRALIDADLVLCDGTPLVWASRFLGNPLPERVAGSDLVPQLIQLAAKKNYRLFFLGAAPDANDEAVAKVHAQFPNLQIGHYSPPFGPLTEAENEEIALRVRATQPDILFVAFGCPKAERWMAANCHSLGVPVVIGVGATIDFLAGRVRRAPMWMQRSGLEWIFRLYQEPRRLFRRYASDLRHFLPAMAAQWWCLKFGIRPGTRTLDREVVRHSTQAWAEVRNCDGLLDLRNVSFIDSAGVAFLLQLRKKFRALGQSFILIAPSRTVQRTLKRMRAWEFFETTNDPA